MYKCKAEGRRRDKWSGLNQRHLHKIKIWNVLHQASLFSHCATVEDAFLLKSVRASSFSQKCQKPKHNNNNATSKKKSRRVTEGKIKNMHGLNTGRERVYITEGSSELPAGDVDLSEYAAVLQNLSCLSWVYVNHIWVFWYSLCPSMLVRSVKLNQR